MSSEPSPGLPSSDTQNQPVETNDKEGNRVFTEKSVELMMQELVPKDATEEQNDAARGYMKGYYLAVKSPGLAAIEIQKFINDPNIILKPEDIGFVLGVEDGRRVTPLVIQTLEAFGVKIPGTVEPSPPS